MWPASRMTSLLQNPLEMKRNSLRSDRELPAGALETGQGCALPLLVLQPVLSWGQGAKSHQQHWKAKDLLYAGWGLLSCWSHAHIHTHIAHTYIHALTHRHICTHKLRMSHNHILHITLTPTYLHILYTYNHTPHDLHICTPHTYKLLTCATYIHHAYSYTNPHTNIFSVPNIYVPYKSPYTYILCARDLTYIHVHTQVFLSFFFLSCLL